MSTWQTVGKVRMTPKGVYDSTVAYDILDLVSNSDETTFYIAKQAVPAGTALTNTSYWVVMADVSEAVENAEDILSYIADAYSTSSAYSVGDYVIHDGTLYKCVVAIPSGENWNSAHWTEASLTGDMSDFGETVDNVVLVQDAEPTNPKNKIWLKETTPEGVQIPTYSEFQTGISAKVNINQGSSNSGKAMIVGSDGNLSPQTIDTGAMSVAGKTGAVTLDGDDVGYSDNYTYDSGTIGNAVSNLKTSINILEPSASASDVGKALIAKTVSGGKVTEYEFGEAGGGGTSDYSDLTNKPSINSVTLSGNKSLSDLGVASEDDVDEIKDVLDITEPGTVNLFDPSNPNTTNLIPKTDGSGQITTSNGVYAVLMQVNPNSTVTMTKTDGNRCQICSFTAPPQKNDYWVQNVMSTDGNTGLSVTITVGATDVYLLFYMATSSSSCDYTKVKIFYGTEWHDGNPNVIDVLTGKFFNQISEKHAFNLVSRRPLGPLSKPYIAISCDDGAADLATTTIPLFKGYKTTYNKNIPLTMGLMSTSAVLADASYTTLVNEMLSDYGCAVATHGGTSYTSYSNEDLIDFLDEQESFIYGKCGENPAGIIYPNHAYDLDKMVIAGSYYGVCAAGYSNGVKYEQCNGARSNMYELHRWSLFVASQTENTIKTVVDYAAENNLLLIPWFHDNALTGNDAVANTALLNYLVSYANGLGIDFISFKDIPSIT